MDWLPGWANDFIFGGFWGTSGGGAVLAGIFALLSYFLSSRRDTKKRVEENAQQNADKLKQLQIDSISEYYRSLKSLIRSYTDISVDHQLTDEYVGVPAKNKRPSTKEEIAGILNQPVYSTFFAALTEVETKMDDVEIHAPKSLGICKQAYDVISTNVTDGMKSKSNFNASKVAAALKSILDEVESAKDADPSQASRKVNT